MPQYRRLGTSIALVLGVFALVGCSASIGGSGLDEEALEGEIAQGLMDRFDDEFAVTCPSDVDPEAGGEFSCVAVGPEGGPLDVDVVQRDDEGNVRWELTTLYAPFVAKAVPNTGQDEVTCPDGIAIEAGGTFECTVIGASGEAETIVATQGSGGKVSFASPPPPVTETPSPEASPTAPGAGGSAGLAQLESNIATRLQSEFSDAFSVECPETVTRRVGASFRCTADGPEEGVRINVEVTSATGDVNWRLGTFYAPQIEREISKQVLAETGARVEVNCPKSQIVSQGNEFRCFLVLPEGGTQNVAVTATDDTGSIRFRTLPR